MELHLDKTARRVRPLVAAVALFCAAAAPISIAQADTVTDSGARAVTWLAKQQQADGGFSNGFTKGSDVGTTADAVVAFAAAKANVTAVKTSAGLTPLDYLATKASSAKLTAGEYAKIAVAVESVGQNPSKFAGTNLIALIEAGYNDKTGVIGENVYAHSIALIALAKAGAIIPGKAITTLVSLQSPEGGWAFMGTGGADVDTTAAAVQALIAVGMPANSGPAGRGLGYLHSLQNVDGGFPYQSPSQYGTDSNTNSTGLVAQAIIASGDQPESWAASRGNPLSAIIILQQASGAYAYQGSFPADNTLATIGAIQALYRFTPAHQK
ncbi:MAG: hypothetical protein M1434_10000 [Chloroflexi bacterium]|nr:hypothetical protein [Chloroflexota bacterium]